MIFCNNSQEWKSFKKQVNINYRISENVSYMMRKKLTSLFLSKRSYLIDRQVKLVFVVFMQLLQSLLATICRPRVDLMRAGAGS